MRVAFLNSIEKDIYGGMEEWIRLAALALASKGHEVTLIGRKDSYFLQRAGEPFENINTFPLNIGGDFNPATIKQIKKFLDENQIDVITVNFNKDVRLGGLAARFNGTTKVIWSVGLNITKDKMIHKLLTPKLVDHVIVPSQSLKNEITELGYISKEITTVIPICIEDIELPEKAESRKKVISMYNLPEDSILSVTSGRLVEQKGHDFLIEAAPDIVKEYPQLRFLFLGDGQREYMYHAMITERRLEKHFVFCGMLDDVETHLSAADIMIHPSRVEPFGIAILEGMRAGLPVIASHVGGIPEVVKDGFNAKLIEAENVKQLSETVNLLLKDRNSLGQMAQNSRERFESEFSLEKMSGKLENVYCSVSSVNV
ncbi:MAG: glycosyltransferase family 1 protein [Calditrichaeota bacterium]|nr:MAG: glycosyltransferase family 1 protein [Calditrichota bacterium]